MRRKNEELSTEDREKIRKAVKDASVPLETYEKISGLANAYYPILDGNGYVGVERAIKNGNAVICTLRTFDQVFEENAIYPLAKCLNEIDSVFTNRFITFLEWHMLKNADVTLK